MNDGPYYNESNENVYETMGPGFFMFFLDFESEVERTVYGGGATPKPEKKVSYKIGDDDVAIALSLLLARRY